MDVADSYKRMSGNGREKKTGSLSEYAARIRLSLRVSAIARFQMKPVMAFFICGNTLLFFLSCFLNLLLRKREEYRRFFWKNTAGLRRSKMLRFNG